MKFFLKNPVLKSLIIFFALLSIVSTLAPFIIIFPPSFYEYLILPWIALYIVLLIFFIVRTFSKKLSRGQVAIILSNLIVIPIICLYFFWVAYHASSGWGALILGFYGIFVCLGYLLFTFLMAAYSQYVFFRDIVILVAFLIGLNFLSNFAPDSSPQENPVKQNVVQNNNVVLSDEELIPIVKQRCESSGGAFIYPEDGISERLGHCKYSQKVENDEYILYVDDSEIEYSGENILGYSFFIKNKKTGEIVTPDVLCTQGYDGDYVTACLDFGFLSDGYAYVVVQEWLHAYQVTVDLQTGEVVNRTNIDPNKEVQYNEDIR